jgi:hypothetical protein
MKKEITTAVLTLATAFAFAQDAIAPVVVTDAPVKLEQKIALPSLEEKVSTRRSFGYLRMGISDSQLPTQGTEQALPGLGVGYRVVVESSAIDISASYNRRDVNTDEGRQKTFVYLYPKANYLYYVSGDSSNSFYAGAGLAWGSVKTADEREFRGIIPNVTVGYEMHRKATIRTFVQLDVSQPAIAAVQTGDLPKAYGELSLGAGF